MEGTGPPDQGGSVPQWLMEFIENQRAVNESLRQLNQQLSAQLELLVNSDTPGLFTRANTAPPPLTPTSVSVTDLQGKPKHSRRHPDLYTHEDESAYPQFQGGLEAKL
jgi:hypothetical protein